MHPLYHDQVIFSDVDIDIGSAKSWKRPTQSALIETFIYTKPPNSFVCSHLKTPRGFLSDV
jgi:hypothetical protein